MNINHMTDEAIALMSRDLDAERVDDCCETGNWDFSKSRQRWECTYCGDPVARPHNFTGIDGRCMDCDARPWGRAAAEPCI